MVQSGISPGGLEFNRESVSTATPGERDSKMRYINLYLKVKCILISNLQRSDPKTVTISNSSIQHKLINYY